jgi:hypothetical protein
MKPLALTQALPETLLKIIAALCVQASAEPLIERLPLALPTEGETSVSIRHKQNAARSYEQGGNRKLKTLHRTHHCIVKKVSRTPMCETRLCDTVSRYASQLTCSRAENLRTIFGMAPIAHATKRFHPLAFRRSAPKRTPRTFDRDRTCQLRGNQHHLRLCHRRGN